MPEASFRCFPNDPDKVRRPDVAFIATERVPANLDEAFISVAPGLVVEIVSANDRVYDMDEKLADYESAGVKLVVVINPNSRVVAVYRRDQPVDRLFDGNTFRADPVLPDFVVQVTDLLPEPVKPKSA